MFLGFPLDYQLIDFVKAAVAPFGRLISWLDGPNKSKVVTKCLLLDPSHVPRSLVVSQGSLVGGMGRSWSVPVFILNGQFPDGFPQDEDPVPFDANPHPNNGAVNEVNPNLPKGGSIICMELLRLFIKMQASMQTTWLKYRKN